MNSEPWYGVRLVYRHTNSATSRFEERIVIVQADDADSAIQKTEQLSREEYEDEGTVYTGYAMAFHVFDEAEDTLGEGVEVFSLVRNSDLSVDDYLDRFHDTGNECARD